MVYALNKYRHYLLGNKFVFYVDHMAPGQQSIGVKPYCSMATVVFGI
jgi:hypothetical protein